MKLPEAVGNHVIENAPFMSVVAEVKGVHVEMPGMRYERTTVFPPSGSPSRLVNMPLKSTLNPSWVEVALVNIDMLLWGSTLM